MSSVTDIFNENISAVWRVLRALGVVESDVGDVCQEVFVTAHQGLPHLDGRAPVRTWLYGLCVRAAADRRECARTRSGPEPERGSAPSDLLEPDDADAAELARTALYRVLDRLDGGARAVFVLHEIEGLAMTDVADVLACSLQTARSHLLSARREVEQAVATPTRGQDHVQSELRACTPAHPLGTLKMPPYVWK